MSSNQKLCQLIDRLYKTTGQLNLYAGLCGQRETIVAERIRSEISRIKNLIVEIENEVNRL